MRGRQLIATVCAVGAMELRAAGQEPPDNPSAAEPLKAWLTQKWVEAAVFPPLPGKRVVWQEYSGVSTVTHSFSCSPDGSTWRYDILQGNRVVDTIVRGPKIAWNSTPTKLTLLNPDDLPPPYQSENANRKFWHQLGRLIHGGFTVGPIAKVIPGEIAVTAGGWSQTACAQMGSAGSFCVRFEGNWNSTDKVAAVSRMVYTQHPNPDAVGVSEVYEQTSDSLRMSSSFYGKVIIQTSGGQEDCTLVLQSVDDIEADRIPVLFTTPDPAYNQKINDLRDGYVIVGDREVAIVPRDSELARQAQALAQKTASSSPTPPVTWTGWAIATVIVTSLVAVAISRSWRVR